MMKKRIIKCMLIPQLIFPIPAVCGGAIETLITNLLTENEKENQLHFVVVCVYDEKALKEKFNNSKICYFKDGIYTGSNGFFLKMVWRLYKIFHRLIQNRITYKLFKCDLPFMDFITFQYALIAIKERVDYVFLEGDENEIALRIFNHIVGKEKVYNHIHYTRMHDQISREWISNSISISDYVRQKWVAEDGIKGKNIVLYNGIDVQKIYNVSYSAVERTIRRRELGISDDELCVIYCGRIMPEKGLNELKEAFLKLQDKKIKLLFVGGIPSERDRYYKFACDYVDSIKDMNNVILCGYVDNNQIATYYKLADIQIIPSVWQEGAGLVAIEGMAAGLPQIVTESGGMVEYVSEENALILPINDMLSDNIVEAIVTLSDDAERRVQMGKAGLKRSKMFSSSQYYKDFVSVVYSS